MSRFRPGAADTSTLFVALPVPDHQQGGGNAGEHVYSEHASKAGSTPVVAVRRGVAVVDQHQLGYGTKDEIAADPVAEDDESPLHRPDAGSRSTRALATGAVASTARPAARVSGEATDLPRSQRVARVERKEHQQTDDNTPKQHGVDSASYVAAARCTPADVGGSVTLRLVPMPQRDQP